MDHFGIGQAIRGVAMIYFRSSRQTGRTLSLIESVKDGDCVCFTNSREAERVKRMCKERGVVIDTIVVNPKEPHGVFERGTAQGRMIFDHTWIEEYYLDAIGRAEKYIDSLQEQLSGYGEPHRETKRRAEEISKWQI